MSRNPPWQRDELILALDLYFKGGRVQLGQEDPRVIELSKLLRSLPIHRERDRDSRFRSVNSVSMKLGNFRSLDPEYTGVGLSQVAKGDQQIWTEFAGSREQLSEVAAAIRSTYSEVSIDGLSEEADIDEEERREGRVLIRVHKQRERNRSLVQRKKEKVLAETGRLACEVCSFDFEEVYGEHGRGFVECHHLTPLAELRAGQKTRLSDLAIVCANCHRMIHRGPELLTPEDLGQMMASGAIQGPHTSRDLDA